MTREEEILKEFEKLGWFVADGFENFVLKKIKKQESSGEYYYNCCISINKKSKTYSTLSIHFFVVSKYELSMQEHKLLHELFKCWGWLDD